MKFIRAVALGKAILTHLTNIGSLIKSPEFSSDDSYLVVRGLMLIFCFQIRHHIISRQQQASEYNLKIINAEFIISSELQLHTHLPFFTRVHS